MLKKLKIRTKIIIMPILAAIAFAIIFLIITFLGNKNNSMLKELDQGYYPALEISNELVDLLAVIQREMQYVVSAQDSEALVETDTKKERFIELIEKASLNPVFRQSQVDSIKTIFNEYYPLARETTLQMLQGNFSEDIVRNLDLMRIRYNEIQSALNASKEEKKQQMAKYIALAQDNQQYMVITIVIVTILGIILLGVVAIIFTRSITHPLQKIVQASEQMSKGAVDIEINVDSEDEIGELARSTSELVQTTKELTKAADAIGQGDYQVPVQIRSDKDILSTAIVRMKNNLQKMTEENKLDDWFKTGHAKLGNKMRGDQTVIELAKNIITFLSVYMEGRIGAIYLKEKGDSLKLVASYAYKKRKNLSNEFKIGEGLVGQAAMEKESIILANVPDDYIKINSGLGEATPVSILVSPLVYDNELTGVIELGSFHEFTENQLKFIEQASENICIALQSALSRIRVKELLEETQAQAEELQSQQEELRVTNEELQTQQEELKVANEELEQQAEILRNSEEKLKQQQGDLQKSNEELERQTVILKDRQEEIEKKNTELERARKDIEEKAEELEMTSKYKSEFLANMSHELRTPLNSIQILSKLLYENKEKNLTEKQLTFAKTIQSSGSDLLGLINEILDLSKIEAGKMTINLEKMSLKILPVYVQQNFEHITSEKKIYLKVNMDENLPEDILTDRQRIEQVLKNLLSNAIKFTEKGGITISIGRPSAEMLRNSPHLDANHSISIAVSDTGIGISDDKKHQIFQAFQQADGTTSRKYGGTGLGLSISRELARLLQGEIFLESEVGKGSTFTLVLPEEVKKDKLKDKADISGTASIKAAVAASDKTEKHVITQEETEPARKPEPEEEKVIEVRDDRHDIAEGDKSILVIEDDANFSKILFDFTREKGYKCLIAGDGEAGLALANQYMPSAIILDVGLPRIDGWTVMERLKNDHDTRHIPVYFISGHDKKLPAMRMGAIGFLTKPVTIESLDKAFQKIERTVNKNIKKVLVVEDDETMRESILELIGGENTKIVAVDKGSSALEELHKDEYDCLVLDLGLSDMSGFDLVEKIKEDKGIQETPIIVYTGKELTKKEESRLSKHAESIIIKGAKSPERLLDEVSLFLHRVEHNGSDGKKIKAVEPSYGDIFKDKKVLIVDDDVRNIFALSSVLEEKGIKIVVAENGKEALEITQNQDDLDLILMDIMMPEMDGYQAMNEIRMDKKNKKLPIIALTAKAMKGDRQKCIDAGANDYLSKPIDVEKLLSVLHVWLYK
ncbi:MAG: response regulator [Calditrichaceae bacterium]|nr:response regulator [Calditrichaceae bacterium]